MKKNILLSLIFFIFFNHNSYSLEWKQHTKKDEFKGTSFDFITSEPVKPNTELKFPYQSMTARMVKYCNNLNNYLIIQFIMNPNLIGGKLDSDLTSRHTVDAKLDGKFYKFDGEIKTNSSVFLIRNSDVAKLSSSKEFMIQFKHYAGTRHYKFDLSSMPQECKK